METSAKDYIASLSWYYKDSAQLKRLQETEAQSQEKDKSTTPQDLELLMSDKRPK